MRLILTDIEIQWVIGMSFDNHEENFVTLNNRDFSKIILSQLERKNDLSDIDSN